MLARSEFRFGRADLDLLECWLPGRKVETDAGGGRHRLQIVFQICFAPFAWRTGMTCSRQVAGAEYLEAMVRPGNEYPQVGSGATGVLAY
jgi:hypothetical protein